jgi:DNA-binding ferritin-like protein
LQRVIKKNKGYKVISKTVGKAGDVPTANIVDENVAWLEKQIWMIKASLA